MFDIQNHYINNINIQRNQINNNHKNNFNINYMQNNQDNYNNLNMNKRNNNENFNISKNINNNNLIEKDYDKDIEDDYNMDRTGIFYSKKNNAIIRNIVNKKDYN